MFPTVGLKNAFNMILLGTHYVLALPYAWDRGHVAGASCMERTVSGNAFQAVGML